MLKYFWKLKTPILIKIISASISIIGIASMPYVLKLLLDYDYSQGAGGVIRIVLLYILAIAVGMMFEYISQRHAWTVRSGFHRLIKKDLFDSLLSKNYQKFNEYNVSDYISFFNNDIVVCSSYLESIINIIQWIFQLLVYGFFLFSLDWRLALLIIFCSILSLILPKITGQKLSEKKKIHLSAMASYTDVLRDLLTGFRIVNRDTRAAISHRHEKVLVDTETKHDQFGKQNTITNVLTGTGMYSLQIIIFAVTGVLLLMQQITVGTASAAMGYIIDFCYPVSYILREINTINASKAGTEKILSIINDKPQETEPIKEFKSSIVFNEVTATLGEFHLKPFSYTFEKGKKYAIIGSSGSGKSTILNLLMQYVPVESGTITIDGEAINGYDTTPIMICINQFEHIFRASFNENADIFGSYSNENYENALSAFSNDKIQSLLDTENSQELSGGEKQMLQLIRAITANKDIILMDEAFSAVDKASADILQKILLSMDKTIIFITHNVDEENLKNFDTIIEMER